MVRHHRWLGDLSVSKAKECVCLEGASLPEGTVVTIFAKDSEEKVHLPPALQAELEEALEEADRDEGISGDELLEKLRTYD